jgi:glycerate dehydrogenase
VDVVSSEPVRADNPLLGARNCIITPHMAWGSLAARRRLMAATVENVRAFLSGKARNLVSR